MLLPKGQPVHENLSASFTQFDAMLGELKNNHFTGYVQVTTSEYEGALLFDTGNVVCAIDEVKGERRSGFAAAQAIAAKGKEKDGTINVYRLPEDRINLLASIWHGGVVYKNLSSDLTGLDNLITKLQGDRHTGCIEVNVNEGKGAGLVFLQSGRLIDSVFSTDGKRAEGDSVVPEMANVTSRFGATFTVYSSDDEKTLTNTSVIRAGLEISWLLGVWEEITAIVERIADSLSTNGHFIDTFKRTLNETARDYPFLHPVIAEFQYKDGRITFLGRPDEKLSKGLSACLSATVAKLAAETPNANLMVRVKAALQEVKQKHAGAVENLVLETKLDLFTMSLYEHVIAEALPFLGNNSTAFMEQQCRESLGVGPEALTGEHLGKLAQRVEITAALLISKEQARDLRQKIESLAKPA